MTLNLTYEKPQKSAKVSHVKNLRIKIVFYFSLFHYFGYSLKEPITIQIHL